MAIEPLNIKKYLNVFLKFFQSLINRKEPEPVGKPLCVGLFKEILRMVPVP